MKKRALLTSIVTALMIVCFGLPQTYAAPVTLRVSLGMPQQHFVTKQYIEWGRLIEKNSNGEIKVEVYHSAQLYRDNEVIKAIQMGGVEAGYALTFVLENQLVPAMKVLMMPFLFQNLDEALGVLHSDIGEAMKKTAEQKGVKLMALVSYPSPEDEVIMTAKPVKVPADLKGMVLRSPGPETSAMIKKWGAGPSYLSGAEVYLALQRGTIKGSLGSLTSVVERKLYEVAPYSIMLPYASIHSYIALNKGFFDRLSPSQQKAVLDASAVIDKNNYSVAMATLKKDVEEFKKKATIYYPNAAELALWKNGCEEVWAETAKSNKDVAEALAKVRAMLKR